ncbi:MAG: protein kinase, partial [bacterium]|nr:protein kinase [bacterium]
THRDIKPGNIMVDTEGRVKVMDFGLARLEEATRITKTGTILGTPAYMSPEQVRGELVDHRTDIWSLGVLIYETLTGRLPFSGESARSVALTIQQAEPEPISAQRASVPPALDRIVGKALAKEPAQRYQHADELLVDLRALKRGRVSDPTVTSAVPAGRPPPQRNRTVRIAGAVVLAVFLVLAGVVASRFFIGPDSETQASLRAVPLTTFEGAEVNPSFSPDGTQVAF